MTFPKPTASLGGATPDRLLVVISDAEMGAGGPLDDFPDNDFFADLILSYTRAPYADLAVDLVFNGDTFDFLKTSYLDEHPRHVTASVALGKLLRIAAEHPRFLAAVRSLLTYRGAPRRVFFVVGNHDPELLFPEVQGAIRAMLGQSDQVFFPGFALDIGDVHIEHGSQDDPLFRMPVDQPFVAHRGEPILNLPWGAVAILDVAMPMQWLFYHHDRVKPRDALLDLMPEISELLSSRYWDYWTRDYWRGWLSGSDPIKRVSWTMFRDVVSRFGSRSFDVYPDQDERELVRHPQRRCTLLGHTHEPSWVSYGDRKLLRTGAFRNEYMLSSDGLEQSLLPKVYAEVYMQGTRVVRSHLVEVDGPMPPPEHVPDSIFVVRPRVAELMGAEAATDQERAAQAAQLERERHETDEVAVTEDDS